MLDPKRIRENFEEIKTGLENRQHSLDGLNAFKAADEQWRTLLVDVDELKNQRNTLTPKGKPEPEQLAKLKEISETIKQKQEALSELELNVKELAMGIPNCPDPSTPIGSSEDDNVEIRKEGTPASFDFEPKPHDEVGTTLGMLDFESGAKVTGSRFVTYTDWGARLERALINFMLDMQRKNGYTEVMPQAIVKSDSLRGTGQLPKFGDDLFKLEDTDYWLSPTAEVQLTNMLANDIVPEADLPVKVTAYAPCFRKEAGSHGKDVKGIIRLHQFNKVELVQFVAPEDSAAALEALTSHAESILKALELPYRVMSLCTADIGFSAAKTYDLEVWFPSQNQYREISSCSNFLDFQSRRAMIRYKSENNGVVQYLHTLNGSGLAVGRTLAAVLENYQTSSGTVRIPNCLRDYLEGETEIPCQTITTSS